jgi:hypothetical protein
MATGAYFPNFVAAIAALPIGPAALRKMAPTALNTLDC